MKTQNHESYYTCKNCGHSYNFWDYGYHCPVCLQHNTPTPRPRLLLLTLFLFLSLFSQSQPSQPSQPSNFLITIKTGKTTEVFKNTSTATADSLLRSATGINSGISGFIQNSPFFEIRTRQTWFYCELKSRHPERSRRAKPSKKSIPGTTAIYNDAQAKIQPNE